MNDFTNEDFNLILGEMEKEQNSGKFQSLYWKPTGDGIFPIRIMTPLTKTFGEKLFYQHHKVHYVNNHAYFCLNQTLKDKNGNVHNAESCPFCNKSKQIYSVSEKGSEDWGVANSLRAKDRYVSRIIIRGKKDNDGNDTEYKPEFWEFGSKIYEYFFNQIKMGIGNFLSLKEGRDYNLVKKGTGRSTSYDGSSLSLNTSPVFTDPEKLKKLLEELPKMDYSQLVEFVSPEEMKSALDEMFNGGQTEIVIGAPVADSLDPMSQPAASVNPVAQTTQPKEGEPSLDELLNMI